MITQAYISFVLHRSNLSKLLISFVRYCGLHENETCNYKRKNAFGDMFSERKQCFMDFVDRQLAHFIQLLCVSHAQH